MTAFFQPMTGLDTQTIRDQIFDMIGWDYRAKSIPPPVMPLMNACQIMTSLTGAYRCNGHLIGVTHNDMAFELREIAARKDMVTQNKHNGPTLDPGFEGVLVSLQHPSSFLGRTIIVIDKGIRNRKIVNGMSRAGFVDREFESRFEVYTDDQVEARTLISPDFMERLMMFQNDMRADNVECVFLGNQLHLALSTKDNFRFGRDFPASRIASAAEKILHEVNDVFLLLEHCQFLHARLGRLGARAQDKARRDFYDETAAALRVRVETAIENGELGKEENAHLSDTAYLVCETLHGLLGPRF